MQIILLDKQYILMVGYICKKIESKRFFFRFVYNAFDNFYEVHMSSTEDRVRRIVCEQLGVGEEEVTSSASFIDDLGADSLDTVELVMAFEEEFECEIPDDAAEKIQTVKDAIDFISSNS